MKLVNLTPHAIVLQAVDGSCTTLPPSGLVARISQTPGDPEAVDGVPVLVYSAGKWGTLEGMPETLDDDTLYVVSSLVLGRCGEMLPRLVAPGTGPGDGPIRNEKGQIVAVTRLVRG